MTKATKQAFEVTLTYTAHNGSVTVHTHTGFAKHKADAICDAMAEFERAGFPLGYGQIEAKAL